MIETLENPVQVEAKTHIPLLSVLIPSVPSRLEKATELFRLLEKLSDLDEVFPGDTAEILMLTDNKQRSIGKKRRALVEAAQGSYVAFVDDDDTVSGSYFVRIFEAIKTNPGVDLITFNTTCRLNGGPVVNVMHGIGFANEQYCPAGFRRAPWHMHAWRREIAQRHADAFPDLNNAEDWPWCAAMLKDVRTNVHIGATLFHYQHDSKKTEAR
jgi:hypothetical protein